MDQQIEKEVAVREALSEVGINKRKKNENIITSAIFISLAALIGFAFLNTTNPHLIWKHFKTINYPLHSTMEAVGAIAAIFMAFLSIELLTEKVKPSYVFISIGFLSMGIWDLFHSIIPSGNGFVLTHSFAFLIGGFFFFLSIFPTSKIVLKKKSIALLGTTLVMITTGILTIIFRSDLPAMVIDHDFTDAADNINFAGGIFFLITAVKLFIDYLRHRSLGVSVLIFVTTLSAIVGLTFQYSHAWTDHWWFWHALRLVAHLSIFVYLLTEFAKSMKERSSALLLFEEKNAELSASEQQLKTREQQLKAFNQQLEATNTDLMRHKQLTDSIIDSLPGIFYQIDTQGQYRRWNRRFLEVTGMTDEEMEKINAVEFFRGDDVQDVADAIKMVFTEGETQVEADLYLKSGDPIPYLFTGVRFDIEGEPFLLGMGLDISNLKKAEKKLKNTVHELEAFNKLAIGREKRMIELKEKINKLSKELGKDEPYDLSFADRDD